jgi:hypothetical protein
LVRVVDQGRQAFEMKVPFNAIQYPGLVLLGNLLIFKSVFLMYTSWRGRNVSSEMRHFHQEFSVAPDRFFEWGD